MGPTWAADAAVLGRGTSAMEGIAAAGSTAAAGAGAAAAALGAALAPPLAPLNAEESFHNESGMMNRRRQAVIAQEGYVEGVTELDSDYIDSHPS